MRIDQTQPSQVNIAKAAIHHARYQIDSLSTGERRILFFVDFGIGGGGIGSGPSVAGFLVDSATNTLKISPVYDIRGGWNASLSYREDTFIYRGDRFDLLYLSISAIVEDSVNSSLADTVVGLYDSLVILNPTGIQGVEQQSDAIRLWPNPTKNNIHLDLPDYASIAEVLVCNPLGQVVHHTKVESLNSIELPASALRAGVYYVRIITGAGVYKGVFEKRDK